MRHLSRSRPWLSAAVASLVVAGTLLGTAGMGGPAESASAAAVPAAGTTKTFVLVVKCPGPTYNPYKQLCPPPRTLTSLVSYSPVLVTYRSTCSSLSLWLFVDGQLKAKTPVSGRRSSVKVEVPWPADGRSHKLGYEAEGGRAAATSSGSPAGKAPS